MTLKNKIMLTTLEEIKVFSDPFRYKILMCFYRKKQPATVKEIAVALNEVPANVHYHVKKLEKAGILQLVYTKEINGIIAKYYEPTAEVFDINYPDEIAAANKQLILSEKKQFLTQIFDESKNIFIEQTAGYPKSDNEHNGTISMEDLYLTKDEAKEFEEYIKNFMDKYSSKTKASEQLNKYHCFFTIVEMKE